MPGIGTIINCLGILAGGLVGLIFGRFMKENIQDALTKVCGVSTLFIAISGALEKLDEETAELRAAVMGEGDVEEELGDVLFAAVKVARFAGVDPEVAIGNTCEKFIRRFRAVENAVRERGADMKDLPLEELTALWEQAKQG